MAVTVSGMFGNNKTYFADSPVVIDIGGLEWPAMSPFNIVRIDVLYGGSVVGTFRTDTGGQSSISFDISSALRAIWSDYGYSDEVSAANNALSASSSRGYQRQYRHYQLQLYTEYLSGDDGGVFTTTSHGPFSGGICAIGGLTEWERSTVGSKENADVSYHEHENNRFGDASTKPLTSPERVGMYSITSWVDLNAADTISVFYPVSAAPSSDSQLSHAPMVLRDSSQPYVDFLFVNRRGAIETCSALMKESMNIGVSVEQYTRVERPSFKPSRSLMAIGTDGRRSWPMSSGYVTREWAEWWTMEFLGGKRKQWWMRYPVGSSAGRYVPVIVKPAKDSTSIYDRSKQQMAHVDFTVTMALEG
ncbi:MAG: hypothetical protein K6B13_08195 [Prevotella sp.]|nr:hypothetical protein [Prevotella sp.]